jgi:hypothetical protein
MDWIDEVTWVVFGKDGKEMYRYPMNRQTIDNLILSILHFSISNTLWSLYLVETCVVRARGTIHITSHPMTSHPNSKLVSLLSNESDQSPLA